MVKYIVFDLGGVLLDFDPLCYIKKMGFTEEQGIYLQKAIWNSKEWHLADLSQITYEGLINGICQDNLDYKNELEYLLRNKDNRYILKQNEENYNYIKKLKELGFGIYLISNITFFDLEFNKEYYDVFKLADGHSFSCEVGFTKPDPRIYEDLLDRYCLNPYECVFIDDLEENCLAASELGMKSILYLNHEDFKTKLDKILEIEDYSLKFKKH